MNFLAKKTGILKFALLTLFFVEAKPVLYISDVGFESVADTNISLQFDLLREKTEKDVLDTFLRKKNVFALLRADYLSTISGSESNSTVSYTVIGRTKFEAILCLASHETASKKTFDQFHKKNISVGLLGNGASKYLKRSLSDPSGLYRMHIISLDMHRSLHRFLKKRLDHIMLFVSKRYIKRLKPYIKPLPGSLYDFMSQNVSSCECTRKVCKVSYYLVATGHFDRTVLENIYHKFRPFLDARSRIDFRLGPVFVSSDHFDFTPIVYENKIERQLEKSTSFTKKVSVQLGRAPWMNIALDEAIKGKGSSEYVLPMLDLSYKYIRFAKGDSGITTAPNDGMFGSWCAAYVCWVLDKSGMRVHKKSRMASQAFRYNKNKLYRKIKKPIFGALVLYKKITDPSHGHVGFLFGLTQDGKYIVLGGNQNNRLKFSAYPKRFGSYALEGFYVPIDYRITEKDKLKNSDIYQSAEFLNKKYGIGYSKKSYNVR